MTDFKKYKVKLKHPLNEDTETALYSTGALAYGELGEDEIIVVTFMDEKELLEKCKIDVKNVTGEINFDQEERYFIEQIREESIAKTEEEFLRYYYLSI